MLYELFTSDLEIFASNVVERRTVNDDEISYHTAVTAVGLIAIISLINWLAFFVQEKWSHRSVNVLRLNSGINSTASRAS